MNARGRLKQALERLLEEKPIDAISVCDLVERADLGRNTFYRLYSDKFELLKEYYFENYVVLFDDAKEPLHLNEMTILLLERFRENQRIVKNMFFSKDGFALKVFFREISIETNVRLWKAKGVDVENDRVLGAIRLYSYGTASLLLEWIKSGMGGDIYVLADQFALAVPAILVAPEKASMLIGERAVESLASAQ